MDGNSRRALIASVLPVLLAARAAPASTHQEPSILRTENDRIILTEYTFQPGVAFKIKPRTYDQLILFIDDCRYERTDPASGLKSLRIHKAGDYIWYNRGGDSATVLNLGSSPFRLILIELK